MIHPFHPGRRRGLQYKVLRPVNMCATSIEQDYKRVSRRVHRGGQLLDFLGKIIIF